MTTLRNKKYIIWICLLFVGIFVLLLYYLVNPADTNLVPQCPFYHITGYKCIGCGLQRAIYYAIHGEFLKALSMNYSLAFTIPVFFLYLVSDLFQGKFQRLFMIMSSKPMIITLFVIMLCWWVLRNIIGV